MITVFTPTYNRAHLLPTLYESLLKQSFTDFEWVIVDDGSSDNSEQIIQDFSAENKINIRYFLQKNGGKHRAINKGVAEAKGILFFNVDSDDYLPENALKTVVEKYEESKSKYKVAGVSGRRIFTTGTIVGSDNFTELVTNSIDIRTKYGVTGDLVEVFEVAVLKQYPFPEFENEKFCAESTIWFRIALSHDLYFFNEGIYVTEYIAGGLTDNSVKIRMQSPKSAMLCYSELEKYNIPLLQKVRANCNFWRFSFNDSTSFVTKIKQVNILYSLIGLPVGVSMYFKDKQQVN